MSDDRRGGFAETIIKIATALGASETRMRWRVQRLENRWRRLGRRTEQRLEQIRYKNKICPACRAINDPDDRRCSECGVRLGSRLWQMLDRVGLVVPSVLSASTLMGICFIAVYARILFAQTGGSAWSLDVYALLEHGANFAPLTLEGQWWRLLSSVVSHGGLVHLAFNLIALYIVGPEVEERYGRFVMPLLFAVTAVVGSLASVYLNHPPAPSIGASGGIMGLIGMAAVRGHLEGGAAGREVRDRMIKWTIYTFILGFAISGIDNWAHAGGLAAGAALGLVRPRWIAPHSRRIPLSLLGIAAIVVAVWLAMAPPQSAGPTRADQPERFDPVTRVYAPAAEACDLAESDPVEAERRIVEIAAQVDESAGPDPVERWCAEIEAMRELCRADDETWRRGMKGDLQLERDWERTCAAIGAPRP